MSNHPARDLQSRADYPWLKVSLLHPRCRVSVQIWRKAVARRLAATQGLAALPEGP